MVYGVMQTHYGQEFRWLFSEEEILRQMNRHGRQLTLEDETWVSCWPIGGSNSSDAVITRLDSDEEIKNFLTERADNELDDPTLFGIAEFYVAVHVEDGSCTQDYLDKFGLTLKDLEQTDDMFDRRKNSEKMISDLKACGYEDFDYERPFYGYNRCMRYSELCSLWEQCCNRGMA